jgi:hypothetical protein
MLKKICSLPGCGREFETTKLNQKYCPNRNCAELKREMKIQEYRKNIDHEKLLINRAMKERDQRRKDAKTKQLEEAIEAAKEFKRQRGGLLVKRSRMEARDDNS